MDRRGATAPPQPPSSREIEIDADRCVHAMAVGASCRACVDACPRDALVLDDQRLGIDTEACDGCGICAAACPRDAIQAGLREPVLGRDDPAHAWAACEAVAAAGEAGVLACLHAIGRDDLARLHGRGVRRLSVACGDCESCERGTRRRRQSLEGALEDVTRLTDDRRLPHLVIDVVDVADWRAARDAGTVASRRSLLMALRGSYSSPARSMGAARRLPAARALGGGTAGDGAHLLPVVPVLDADRCIACDASARICPDGALSVTAVDDGATRGPPHAVGGAVPTAIARTGSGIAAYTISPQYCSGCRLCVDVCEVGAMRLLPWQPARPARIALDAKQCASCGNVFRVVAGQAADGQRCRICSAANPNGRLFQVLE